MHISEIVKKNYLPQNRNQTKLKVFWRFVMSQIQMKKKEMFVLTSFLNWQFGNVRCPPKSPDLIPLDIFIWLQVKTELHQKSSCSYATYNSYE